MKAKKAKKTTTKRAYRKKNRRSSLVPARNATEPMPYGTPDSPITGASSSGELKCSAANKIYVPSVNIRQLSDWDFSKIKLVRLQTRDHIGILPGVNGISCELVDIGYRVVVPLPLSNGPEYKVIATTEVEHGKTKAWLCFDTFCADLNEICSPPKQSHPSPIDTDKFALVKQSIIGIEIPLAIYDMLPDCRPVKPSPPVEIVRIEEKAEKLTIH